MIINVKVITNTSQVLKISFWLVGVPEEKPFENYVVIFFNKTTSTAHKMGEIEGDDFKTIINQLRSYLINSFSPISTEVTFSKEFDDFSDDEILYINSLLKM